MASLAGAGSLGTGAARPFPPQAHESLHAPFERLSDSGALGAVAIACDASALSELARLHARDEAFELMGLPLPGGIEARLVLHPVSVMPPGAKAQVMEADGSVLWLAPSVKCFSGSIQGGGEAFFGITRDAVHGYFQSGGELYFLSSGGSPSGQALLAHSSLSGALPTPCGLDGQRWAEEIGGGGRALSVAGPALEIADVFIEADRPYRDRFASNQACIDYSTLLLTAVSEIYRRDVGASLRVPNGYLRVWNTTPPWGPITGFSSLQNVYTWWQSAQNPQQALPRAAVHVFTNPVFGGTARGVEALCNTARAYEISSLSGSFPYPLEHTHRDNWDLLVVAHEFGHTFGSPHSADYVPPIECQDGSGPDRGTIMSYCNTQFGTAAVGMRFHLREQLRIREHIASVACLQTVPLARGDYDADGRPDLDDLLVANAVVGQGFRSLGAEEAFDMDGDGDFDSSDLGALSVLAGVPSASATPRNGSGVNPACLLSPGAPLLGTTWRPMVRTASAGQWTSLTLYDLPHAGLATPVGELLGRPPALGGRVLWRSTALSSGLLATHAIPIPFDLALAGSRAVLQGARLGPPIRLCNALDLVLSPFE